MRFLSVLASAMVFAHGAMSQSDFLDRLPSCALHCLEATLTTTTCSPTDFGCLCADMPFMTATAACNAGNCTVVEILQSTNETYAACGIPIHDQTDTLMGVCASFAAVAMIMVVMRLADRGISAHARLGWDDLLIGLSGFVSLGMNVPVIVAANLGFGRDMWGIKPDNITASLKWLYVAYFTYMLSECLCQLSLLAFYLRIMTDRATRQVVWVLLIAVVGFGIGNTVAMLFQCTPISFFWDGWRGEMDGLCGVNVQLFGFIRGGLEILLDLAILALPLPMLAKLNMSSKKKIQIMSMFCVGFVITVVSCLRIRSFVQFASTKNPTYDNTSGLYWCTTECNLFIIVACMPAISALMHKTTRRIYKVNSYPSNNQYGSHSVKTGSYLRHTSEGGSKSLPFGAITKSTDVDVYRTKRSSSDVELVKFTPSS